jgi:Superinfection immunity protein
MGGIALIFLVCLYFLPTIIAGARHKQNTVAIGALNLFLGWSFIGWIVALIWALSADPQIHQHVVNVSQNVGMPYYPQAGIPQSPTPPYAPTGNAPRLDYPMPQEMPQQPASQPPRHPTYYQPPDNS